MKQTIYFSTLLISACISTNMFTFYFIGVVVNLFYVAEEMKGIKEPLRFVYLATFLVSLLSWLLVPVFVVKEKIDR